MSGNFLNLAPEGKGQWFVYHNPQILEVNPEHDLVSQQRPMEQWSRRKPACVQWYLRAGPRWALYHMRPPDALIAWTIILTLQRKKPSSGISHDSWSISLALQNVEISLLYCDGRCKQYPWQIITCPLLLSQDRTSESSSTQVWAASTNRSTDGSQFIQEELKRNCNPHRSANSLHETCQVRYYPSYPLPLKGLCIIIIF